MNKLLVIALSFAFNFALAQTLPISAASKASGPKLAPELGIDKPTARPLIEKTLAPVQAKAPASIPLSKEADQACKAYFEKNKKELEACKAS